MSICLFEDCSISTLLPLTYVQPDFDLRCGIFTPRERLARRFPDASLSLFVRPELTEVMAERTGLTVNSVNDATLFVNGRALLDASLLDRINASMGSDVVFVNGGVMIAATAASEAFRTELFAWLRSRSGVEASSATGIPTAAIEHHRVKLTDVQCQLISYPWDLIEYNVPMLEEDAACFPLGVIESDAMVDPTAVLSVKDRMYIAAGVTIAPGVVLDASEGPIVVDRNSILQPQAVLLGPVSIGANSRIKIGAKIYHGSSIGPSCKIGGEIEGSIFHSYSNKQHDGFVGHSYFAQWTNLGADSNTSDLKNNYSSIRVVQEGKEIDTGRMFLGTIMADHSKCGINTMFNTGSMIGLGCNIFGGGFPPKFLPSFTWGGADGLVQYEFDKFLETAALVMKRRGVKLTDAELRLLRDVFNRTALLRVDL